MMPTVMPMVARVLVMGAMASGLCIGRKIGEDTGKQCEQGKLFHKIGFGNNCLNYCSNERASKVSFLLLLGFWRPLSED
jgi:hypothetical protein